MIGKIIEDVINAPTSEMRDWFDKRTREHIKRVGENLKRIATWYDFDRVDIKYRITNHDSSKYSQSEKIPYVFLSWSYKCKYEGKEYEYPENWKARIDKATERHVRVNTHHPEAHDDPSDMNSLDLAEMVADWAAMAQELKTSLKEWADNNIGQKWKFSEKQVKFIYELIALFPELNGKEKSWTRPQKHLSVLLPLLLPVMAAGSKLTGIFITLIS